MKKWKKEDVLEGLCRRYTNRKRNNVFPNRQYKEHYHVKEKQNVVISYLLMVI